MHCACDHFTIRIDGNGQQFLPPFKNIGRMNKGKGINCDLLKKFCAFAAAAAAAYKQIAVEQITN